MISHPKRARAETRGRLVRTGYSFLISQETTPKGYRKADMHVMRLPLSRVLQQNGIILRFKVLLSLDRSVMLSPTSNGWEKIMIDLA